MWGKITSFIIRQRIPILSVVFLFTVFMAYKAKDIKLSYELAQVIPKDDKDFLEYTNFKEEFGEDGNLFVIGVKTSDLFQISFFNKWYDLAKQIESKNGIDGVFGFPEVLNLYKDVEQKRFITRKIFESKPKNQSELDSLKNVLLTLPFYKGRLYNEANQTTFLAVDINQKVLKSKERVVIINEIVELVEKEFEHSSSKIYYSGLPYIRTKVAKMAEGELKFFSFFSLVVCALILLLFFRSLGSVVFPTIVILIIVIWSLGTVVLFDYKINVITGLIPPLIIIIGVPNFIYFLNKYHNEYKKHGNKMKAIHRMVEKIGVVTFMTNATTAIGFLVLALTDSPVLKEFGLVAGINIVATFVVSILLLPVLFSYLPEPSAKHTNYLDAKLMNKILDAIDRWVLYKRKWVFGITAILVCVAGYGMTRLKAESFIVDDLPHNHDVYTDLLFFEENFNGVMPFEVIIDGGKDNAVNDLDLLTRISAFEDTLKNEAYLSPTLSIVSLIKFTKQAYYNGNPSRYDLPSRRERPFLVSYLNNSDGTDQVVNNLVDSSQRIIRVSAMMADVGTIKVYNMINRLKEAGDEIFKSDFDFKFTGVSLVFMKNNSYLIKSLIYSLILAFVLISFLMGMLFKNIKMIAISLLPNFIPLLVTAGMMGYLGIPLKPSTVLVFSIAFGISIDDALHFLAKYRQELKNHSWNIKKTISISLLETGRSMIYTSIVLFCGFSIFMFSDFGGTQALGLLTSTTLLIAMLTNIVLLPSLIIAFYPVRDV